MAFNRACQM